MDSCANYNSSKVMKNNLPRFAKKSKHRSCIVTIFYHDDINKLIPDKQKREEKINVSG